MTDPPAQPRSASLVGTLRQIYLNQRTGILRIGGEDKEERLYFVSGGLYLPPDHQSAIAAHQWLGSGAKYRGSEEVADLISDRAGDDEEAAAGSVASAGAAGWAPELTGSMLSAEHGEVEFEEGTRHIPLDLVGPLPTGNLLMDLTVADRDESGLLRILGGEEQRYVVRPGTEDSEELPELDPLDAFFLSRLEQSASVRELLRVPDQSREAALKSLCRLHTVCLILPEEVVLPSTASGLVSPELLERFLSRISEDLEQKPLDLEVEAHRKRVVELLGEFGGLTHFELLDVGLGCTTEELHVAYTEMARVVHPDHAEALGVQGKEGALRMLFERATEAYLTLSDPDRSRDYQIGLGDSLPTVHSGKDRSKRQEEEKEVAAHNYRAARNKALQNDYHSAIQLLYQAVRADPRPEYYALLARCQAENPQWIKKAIFSCSKAVELSPNDPKLRAELGELYERDGRSARAREEFQAALDRMPGLPEAIEGLERLASPVSKPEKKGLLSRFLSRDRPES